MNDSIINKFVNNLPYELHAFDPIVGKYSACGPGTKHEKRIRKYIETGNTDYIYKNDLDKFCFYHDSSYNKFKDVKARQKGDMELMDQSKIIMDDLTKDGYQRAIAKLIYNFFEKKIQWGQGWSEQLADELHKPVRRKFKRRSVKVDGFDDVWSADLVEMQEWSKSNKGYRYILTVIDVYSKYAWGVPLKDKKASTVKNAFETIIKTSKRAPNSIWVDRGSEFYNRVMDKWLDDNAIGRYSTYSEHKSSVVERFNRTLKTKMWKRFTAENTRNWIDMLPSLVNQYNNTYHSTIKMPPSDVNLGTVLNSRQNTSQVAPKYKVGDTVRISRLKGTFEKGYLPNWSEQVYKISAAKKTAPPTYTLIDLKNNKIEGSFYEPELQKASQEVFRIEKILRKKKIEGKMHGLVKWMGYDNTWNSWEPMSNLIHMI